MRVLVVAPNDLRVYDGTTVRITGLIKYSSPYLNTIYLASSTLNSDLARIGNLVWIHLKRLRLSSLILGNYLSIVSRHALDSLVTSVLLGDSGCTPEVDIDVVHAHWIVTLPIAYGFEKIRKIDAPIMIDLHGLIELQSHRTTSFLGRIATFLLRVIERLRIKSRAVASFTVPSEEFREYLVKRFGFPIERIHVVHDGIELDSISPYREDVVNGIKVALGLQGKHVVSYIGTTDYYHGFYDLLKAFKIASNAINDLHMLLIVPKRIEALSILRNMGIEESKVRILENIPRNKIYDYLRVADVLVLPHRKGTQFDYLYSNKLLDYIASGKPIVTYALASVKRLLKHYPLKVLVKPNDPQSLAQGIVEALKRFDGKHIDGRLYLTDYDWKKIGRELTKVYRQEVRCVNPC